jgi:hypothetical protein
MNLLRWLAIFSTAALTVFSARAQNECDPKLFMDNFYNCSRDVQRLYYAHNLTQDEFNQKTKSGNWSFHLPYIDAAASNNFSVFDQQRSAIEEATQWSRDSDNFTLDKSTAWGVLGEEAYEKCTGAGGPIKLTVDKETMPLTTLFY